MPNYMQWHSSDNKLLCVCDRMAKINRTQSFDNPFPYIYVTESSETNHYTETDSVAA